MSNAENKLPGYFQPILWSYDFKQIDCEKDKQTIIVNAINYGDLEHWRWIKSSYGLDGVHTVLAKVPQTQIRDKVKPLVEILFSFNNWNYALRSSHT